ncbi:MAG TPA: hypothetical protein PLX38_09390 [Gammaproteobacteria bacterium]|nr:hypothetical protein [Xanthomonadales bacterium]HOP22302.1 hypothetical protein [Gammaproteobacteria bacterium]HPI96420.1 hypothetical protein [Gammaproteobacteria bacterium]
MTKNYIFIILIILSSCNFNEMNAKFRSFISDLETVLNEKCEPEILLGWGQINNKITYIKINIFEEKEITCDNEKIIEIIDNFSFEKLGYNDIEYYLIYYENEKMRMEQIK